MTPIGSLRKIISAMSKTEAPLGKVNLRTPAVMSLVQAEVDQHYRSPLVEYLQGTGGCLSAGGLTVRLAKAFGFCYGVERAIDLAYATTKVFQGRRIFLLGEIIHNPEVNDQLTALGIQRLHELGGESDLDNLDDSDVVIVPAFGAQVKTMARIAQIGCQIVDTTCGDVMTVWKRVRQYRREGVTSIIHGKAWHEETKATASRAVGEEGTGHYLVVYDLAETDLVCEYIRKGGNKENFLRKFQGAISPAFDPDVHLQFVGVANQTTMMRGETEEVQRRIRQAIVDRYGSEKLLDHFRFFDTICGATQERQDALREMLDRRKLDLLIVVGGYNSSNTSHLAEMGESRLPTYFLKNAEKIISTSHIQHWDLHKGCEVLTDRWLPDGNVEIGITAGASCPNNLIEETIRRLYELREVDVAAILPVHAS
ncbi:4-hydroxy-3-methylbut-2-en-1-yl diphosphate reductase [Methylacidimicrobium tartarophylax]|uniref:4-hydroxy-3-methylbut-2-enyl diphosphate reductase n=2 Tax=Methylacidimicrobium tartarophylax TaxID=1041768 RepID=A0A5E6MDE9_9BACT|nr:4-hydroxy-3-methylbut-2-en-1-yl diphosphate reductase [Methylacidimicrobium tartarophylax]